MWTHKALLRLSDNKTYNRDDLYRVFSSEKPDLGAGAFRWTLYNLQRQQKIFRIGYDAYTILKPNHLPEYHPIYSDTASTVSRKISDKYPDIDFVATESVLLNEFLNHQIAQNTVYVHIEKEISSFIFDFLQEDYTGSVLYKPTKNEFNRYWTKNCIVVLDLISQSPLSSEKPHEICIEKLLVDIIAEKSIAATFSPSELPFIFENVLENYQVDKRKLNRYAGRRGKTEQIKKLTGGK